MKKILITLMIPFSVFAEHSSEIKSWMEVIPEKGYILSNDLHHEKMCAKIWTKQIQEFKKMNPHIQNPDMILVHQKIQVQDCRGTEKEEIVLLNPIEVKSESKPETKKDEYFVGAYAGASFLGGKKYDSSKDGYNMGLKVGMNKYLENKMLQMSIGYLENRSETRDRSNKLGVYDIKTPSLTLEAAMLYNIGEKMQIGPMATALISQDTSLSDSNKHRAVAGYLGVDSLYPLTKSLDLEMNLQQAVDSRVNLMGNVGLKFKF